jgi:hypothetical protein
MPVAVMECPVCGNEGDPFEEPGISGREGFDRRGKWPDKPWPVVKCRSCGHGLLVKPGFIGLGRRVGVIPPDTWDRMQRMWTKEVERLESAGSKPFACEACGRRFKSQSALDAHTADKHKRKGDDFERRTQTSFTRAQDRFEDRLEAAGIDPWLAYGLLAGAWGASFALGSWGKGLLLVADEPDRQAELLDFARRLPDEGVAERAIRAGAWIYGVGRWAEWWPAKPETVLDELQAAGLLTVEEAGPLTELWSLAAKTHSSDVDIGTYARFNRRSLEWILEQGMGHHHEVWDLLAIQAWTEARVEIGLQRMYDALDKFKASDPQAFE